MSSSKHIFANVGDLILASLFYFYSSEFQFDVFAEFSKANVFFVFPSTSNSHDMVREFFMSSDQFLWPTNNACFYCSHSLIRTRPVYPTFMGIRNAFSPLTSTNTLGSYDLRAPKQIAVSAAGVFPRTSDCLDERGLVVLKPVFLSYPFDPSFARINPWNS